MPRVPIDATGIEDGKVTVAGPDARHLLKVLRLGVGDSVKAFAPGGFEWDAEIVEAKETRVVLELGAQRAVSRESPTRLVLGVGLTKGDSLDRVIRMATELGVHEIHPLQTERSVAEAPGAEKAERWKRIATEACKQCGRNQFPVVHDAAGLDVFIVRCREIPRKLLFWENGETPLQNVAQSAGGHETTSLVIGPEGGLTEAEVRAAESAGFISVRLGPRILRAETAAIAAVSALQLVWGDL